MVIFGGVILCWNSVFLWNFLFIIEVFCFGQCMLALPWKSMSTITKIGFHQRQCFEQGISVIQELLFDSL